MGNLHPFAAEYVVVRLLPLWRYLALQSPLTSVEGDKRV